MQETIVTQHQKIAPIWVKTEAIPEIPGYEVQKLLGQGGMGQVYQARHLKLQRMVAIKLVTATNNELALARFEQEVQAVARLRHPHIAQIYENGVVEGRPFYSMEFISGGTLGERVKASPLQPEVAARLVLKLAKAIQHAHKQGILHRDLKPSNILLEAPQPQTNSQDALEPEPKIADFGLAKKLDDDSSLTRTGDVFGSPSYMSPEQASGIGKLTPAVDVYALGAILYECLSGRPPFLGPDAMLTIMMVLSNDPVPPRQILPKLPADLETICLKCLEKQPRKRYASAGELAADLERYLGGEPILARPVGRLERFIKWSRRRPWQAASAGLALALLLGSVIGLLLLNSAYREAIRANEVSDQSFTISRDTVSDLLNQLSGELSLVPNMGKLTLKSYRQVVELFSRLHAIRPEDRSTALAYEEHLQGLVHQLVFQGRHDEALQFAIKLGELVQQERRKRVNDIDWRLAELRYAVSMGWLYRQMQLPEKAMPYDVQAMERLDSLKHEQPENIKLLHYSNELLRNAISDDIARLTAVETVAEKKALMDRVLQHHRDIIENCERTFAQVPEYQQAVALISSRRSLAMMLVALQQTEEAERLYHSIQESLKNIQFPEREQISFLVQTKTDLHELARQRLDWEQAAIHLKEAKEANHRLRVLYPDDGLYFHQEFQLRFKAACLLFDREGQQKAMDELEKLLNELDAVIPARPTEQALKDLRHNIKQQLNRYAAVMGNSKTVEDK